MRVLFNPVSVNLNPIKQSQGKVDKSQPSGQVERSLQNELISSDGAFAIRSSVMAAASFKGSEIDPVEEDSNKPITVKDEDLGIEIHYQKDGKTISYIKDFENEKVIYFKPDGIMIDHEVDYKGNVTLPY